MAPGFSLHRQLPLDPSLLLKDIKSPWSASIQRDHSSSLQQDCFQPLGFGGRNFAGFFHPMNVRQIEWIWGWPLGMALKPAACARHQNLPDDCHHQSDNECDAAGDGCLPSDSR